jgi:uncharacterized RmlC-like cupin family protein
MAIEAILYLISGSGVLFVKASLEETPQRHAVGKGDFVVIPPWTEYQVCNETPNSGDDAVWLVVQNGARPVGANLTDWGGAETSTRG